jgi:hypothetical protein
VDPNPETGVVGRGRLGEPDEGMLGRDVGWKLGRIVCASTDAILMIEPPPLASMGLISAIIAYATPSKLIPRTWRQFSRGLMQQARLAGDAGVVHRQMKSAELGRSLLHRRAYLLEIRDVPGQSQKFPPVQAPQFRSGGVEFRTSRPDLLTPSSSPDLGHAGRGPGLVDACR